VSQWLGNDSSRAAGPSRPARGARSRSEGFVDGPPPTPEAFHTGEQPPRRRRWLDVLAIGLAALVVAPATGS